MSPGGTWRGTWIAADGPRTLLADRRPPRSVRACPLGRGKQDRPEGTAGAVEESICSSTEIRTPPARSMASIASGRRRSSAGTGRTRDDNPVRVALLDALEEQIERRPGHDAGRHIEIDTLVDERVVVRCGVGSVFRELLALGDDARPSQDR